MPFRLLLTLYLALSAVSCGMEAGEATPPSKARNDQVLRMPLDTAGSYVFNPVTGDSIEQVLDQNGMPFATMKPIPAKGRVDEFFQQPTKVVPAKWEKLDKQPTSNIRPISVDIINRPLVYDTLEVVKDDTYVLKSAIGDTIPTGVPLKIEGKKTPVKYPQPVPSLPPVLHYDGGVNLKRLGVDQGLRSEAASGLVEDRYGNKWISYLGMGLSKYDGHSFWHFTEKEGLPNTYLWGIWEARNGDLWLNTLHEGVIVFDGRTFTNYSAKEGFPGNGVRDIFEDSKGNIWLMRRYGVSKYDGEAFTHFTTKEGLVDNSIIRIFEDKEGIIWMVGFGKVSKYDGDSFTNFAIRHPEGTGYINPLFEDQEGHLWLSSETELFRYDGTSFNRFPANLREFRLYWEEDTTSGHIWIAFYGDHIYKFDGETFWEYALTDEVIGLSIERITKDEAGNIWVCTAGLGVYILNEHSFRSTANFAGQTKSGKANKRWIALSSGELNKYEDGHFWRLAGSDQRANIGPVLEDRNQNVWMGLYRGVATYDGQRITYYRADTNRDLFTTQAITEDHLGNIWLARTHGVIVKYDGEQFTRYGAQDGLPPNRFTYSIEDQQHNLWFCSAGGGLVKFDGTSFTVFSEKEGLSSNDIISMAEDQAGNIWLGTNGRGLMKFDGTSFTYYTENDGLSHNLVTSIVAGPENQIWVGTGNGLNVLIPKSDQQSSDIKEDPKEALVQKEYTIYSFSKKDGLLDNMVGWNTLSINEDNILSVPHNFQLDLNHFTLPQAPISVQLDHLDINGRTIDFRAPEQNVPSGVDYKEVPAFFNYPSNPTFSYNYNHLTFHYSATDWSAPHKVQYSYRLNGSDEAWSVPSSETKADFRNLPPGWHTFEVRAMGQSQKWGEPFVYTFRVLPPWWRTWWAYTAYFFLMAGLVYSLYRYQLRRQLQKQETENLKALDAFKNELYTNITHEFRTPLTVISGMADQIDGQHKIKSLIKRNSLNLLNLVNQILDLRKLELGKLKLELIQGDVVQYLKYILVSYEAMAGLKGVNLHFLPKEKEIFMDFDQEKLLRIVSNLLSNAIKFTPKDGQVYLMLEKSSTQSETGQMAEALYLRVSDTGTGIPKEKQAYIFDRFYQVEEDAGSKTNKYQYRGPGSSERKAGSGIGLALTKDLITLMGGSISLESAPGEGSSFTVLLPITREAIKVEVEQEVVEQLSTMEFDPVSVKNETEPLLPKVSSVEKGSELSLLIIEDNRDVQQYLITLLESKYTLYLANDGQEGIEMAFEHIPDLIVSDVMMPEKDGLEVCDTLKNDDRTSHIPIVLLTAKTSVESRIQGLERGADAYLAKPFNEKELFIRLEKLAELRRLLQQRYQHVRPPVAASQIQAAASFEKEDAFMAKLQKIVEDNLDNPDFGPTQLCKALGMSRSQLHLKIKALANRSTSIFIRTIRLHKARELLQQGELNVTQVAFEVGFSDLSYFSRKFTEEFGVNPQKVVQS